MTNGDVYILFGGNGEYEDYHEYILYMFDNLKEALDKAKELRIRDKKDIEKCNKFLNLLNSYDNIYDVESLWDENCKAVLFDDYLYEPEEYKEYLQLFTPPEAEVIKKYVKAYQRFEELGGYSTLSDGDTMYFIRVYSRTSTGKMYLEDTIYFPQESEEELA